MKKFTVRPALTGNRKIRIGGGEEGADWVALGRLGEAGALTSIVQDVSMEHVVAIVGKRGSGKSYTLGSLLEGLCTDPNGTAIGSISGKRAVLLFDTLGIFQWTDIAVTQDAKAEAVQRQFLAKGNWDIPAIRTHVAIWRPASGGDVRVRTGQRELTVKPADLDASAWGYLLGLDVMQDRMGQLLGDAYEKVSIEGWSTGKGNQRPKTDFEIADLVACIVSDQELGASYQSETRRALAQQLTTFDRSTLFRANGTDLRELLVPGVMSVIVMNKMTDELRLVLITAIIRKVLRSRIEASELEKDLLIRNDLSSQERTDMQAALALSAPRCWIAADEAQNFLPSERRTNATDTLVRLVREGRNSGLSFVLTTQQPSAIDNRIMAQVDTLISHKLTVQTDIDYIRRNLKSALPEEVRYNNQELGFDGLLHSLDVGQAVVSSTESERAMIVDIRPRISVHGGF
ncbi:MAG: ATP-binding protein [Deltaproteobacteria bacterium]|nr:ATP-binding protein [Deltaproteobacteria bacterium]